MKGFQEGKILLPGAVQSSLGWQDLRFHHSSRLLDDQADKIDILSMYLWGRAGRWEDRSPVLLCQVVCPVLAFHGGDGGSSPFLKFAFFISSLLLDHCHWMTSRHLLDQPPVQNPFG